MNDDQWKTSSYSITGETCVEVSTTTQVRVRDTKARDLGYFTISTAAWREFIPWAVAQ